MCIARKSNGNTLKFVSGICNYKKKTELPIKHSLKGSSTDSEDDFHVNTMQKPWSKKVINEFVNSFSINQHDQSKGYKH